jgi:transcription elongation factor GreA
MNSDCIRGWSRSAERTKGRGSILPPEQPAPAPDRAVPVSEGLSLNDKEIVLTPEGLSKLETELDELKTVHRREVNDRIRQAKEYGDLSENAEYENAKQEQAFIEGRILKLEGMIRNARLIDESEYAADEVHLGAVVKVKDLKNGETYEFSIVGSAEADPSNSRISNESPLGRALIGHKKGATVDVVTPRGVVKYKIEAIKSNSPKKTAKKAS